VDFELTRGVVELCPGTDFRLRLPLTEEFGAVDLSEDMSEEIRQVEHH
jgi:acetolactate decarboxylase